MTEKKPVDASTDETTTDQPADGAVADSVAQVQETVDAENAKGYRGHNPDPTPNEHYTFAGQAAGKPTPETDPHMAALTGKAVHRHAGHVLREHLEGTKTEGK